MTSVCLCVGYTAWHCQLHSSVGSAAAAATATIAIKVMDQLNSTECSSPSVPVRATPNHPLQLAMPRRGFYVTLYSEEAGTTFLFAEFRWNFVSAPLAKP